MDVLQSVVDEAPRERWVQLFSLILVTGAGSNLPGMIQRIESELRVLRRDPAMPRQLLPCLLNRQESITRCDMAAWWGAVASARLAQDLRISQSWVTKAQFERAPYFATKEAMRHGKASMEQASGASKFAKKHLAH